MSPGGLLEEGSKALSTAFDALKSTFLALALVLINFSLVVFLFWYSANILEQRTKTVHLITDVIRETNRSLASCVSDEVMHGLIEAVRQGREFHIKKPEPFQPPNLEDVR